MGKPIPLIWSQGEKDVLLEMLALGKNLEDVFPALNGWRRTQELPERSLSSVGAQFYAMRRELGGVDKGTRAKGPGTANRHAWSDDEKDYLRLLMKVEGQDEPVAVANWLAKFPGRRSRKAVSDQYYKMGVRDQAAKKTVERLENLVPATAAVLPSHEGLLNLSEPKVEDRLLTEFEGTSVKADPGPPAKENGTQWVFLNTTETKRARIQAASMVVDALAGLSQRDCELVLDVARAVIRLEDPSK